LTEGINKIEHSNLKFAKVVVDDKHTWKCNLVTKDDDDIDTTLDMVRDVDAFMIGDLKFLSMMLGEENFDGNWCYLCQLYIDECELHDHKHIDGIRWTLKKLSDQAVKCKSSRLDGKAYMGVREKPYFYICG